ncbi:MAG: viroplasmin family protein [Clostridiaceae bacterium]|nr:viroplasmin family protein [Clostridiaceae bacterium]
MGKKVYAIKEGFNSNTNEKIKDKLVDSWAECLKYVKGVKGAKYKSFEDVNEAKRFLTDSGDVLKKEDNNYPEDCLHIYVDGSYNDASEEYSYGIVAVLKDVVLYIESGVGKSDSTKNIRQIAGELEAAVKGCQYALSKGEKKVVIFHDYVGICYHATGFWDRKEESSKEYYKKMQELMLTGIEVIFVKVDSHTGDLFNELVDEKCKEKLSIQSDKTIEKWLLKKTITVGSEDVKQEILKIAPNGEKNIIVLDSDIKKNKDEIKAYEFNEIVTGTTRIRIATIDDIDSLVKLRIRLLKEANSNIENYDWNKYSDALKVFYSDSLIDGKVIAFLVEQNGNIVATSIICFYNITPLLYNLDGKMALLTDMYTIPEYRNKGFATTLLSNIMEHTKKMGYLKVVLNATDAGRKLYEKYGFKVVAGEMSYKFK